MDYRKIHLDRGEEYDDNLAQEPFSLYMTQIEQSLLKKIIPSLFPDKIPAYLDFACGTARITSAVAPMSKISYGVDISASMLEKAKTKCPNTTFINTDITQEPLEIDPVNLITSFRFFGNAQNDLRIEVLTVLNKLLKKEGYLIINNHRNPWSLRNILLRMNGGKTDLDLTPVRINKLLIDHGFAVKKSYAIGTWVFRSALAQSKHLHSTKAHILERFSGIPGVSLISPDTIIVAQKQS